MNLNEFIVQAKKSGYAGKGTNKKVLKDGAKQFMFRAGNFKYRDRYYGFNPFIGEEIVWRKDKIVWSMNYFGKVYNNVSTKKVYNFLKSALRQVEEDEPFRGPSRFKKEDFKYVNRFEGSINEFKGMEKIFFKEKEVYILYYHGGVMK